MADSARDGESVHDDVLKLAQYFESTYHSLEKALAQFDPSIEFDIHSFIYELKRWGVQVSEPYELFAHIDVDFSGRITLDELFAVLSQPVAEVQEREQRRQNAEVTRIYKELASCVHHQFGGSLVEVFKAIDAPSIGEISIAGFRRLVKKLGVTLTAAQVDRVFHRIDENKTETVSMQEFKDAIGYYLVHSDLVDMAMFLAERDGSVTEAFQNSERHRVGTGLPGSPPNSLASLPPVMPTASSATVAGAATQPMDLEDFLRLLRRIKVLGEGDKTFITNERALLLFSYLPTSTTEEFRQRLEMLHAQEVEEKKDLEQQKKRAEQLKKSRAFTEFNGGIRTRSKFRDTSNQWRNEVETWTAEAGKAARAGGFIRPEDVSQRWEYAARAGASHAQLQDYLALLEHSIQQRETGPGGLHELQGEIAELENVQKWDDSPLSPTTPSSFQMSGGRVRLQPGLEQTSKQQKKAVQAKQLIQLVATGDVVKLQGFLRQRGDANLVGWGGVTPLMTAARHGREGALQILLTARADINRTDAYGRTAVDHAQHGSSMHRPGVMSCLRGHGGVSGKELKAQVDAMARRIFDIETKCTKLNDYKAQLPSREEVNEYKDVLRRTHTRQNLARVNSRGPQDLTPRRSTETTPRGMTPPFDDYAQGYAGYEETPSFSMGKFMADAQAAVSSLQGPLARPPMLPIPMLPRPGAVAQRW